MLPQAEKLARGPAARLTDNSVSSERYLLPSGDERVARIHHGRERNDQARSIMRTRLRSRDGKRIDGAYLRRKPLHLTNLETKSVVSGAPE
jgi:hypothetical protein